MSTADFDWIWRTYRGALLDSKPVEVGSWHSMPTNGNPMLVTMEVPFVDLSYDVPPTIEELQGSVKPNLPWAEDHFQERVDGRPMNPAPSHRWWPWAHGQHHDENEQFSHTYPERFWPVFANEGGTCADSQRVIAVPHVGIRYEWGSLGDVVNQLIDNIYTRQAVLPVFFPEDTGNKSKVRVPCSLTYHFLYRDDRLHVRYDMRSCDFVRHFRDDVYMAARLLQWVCGHTQTTPGRLHMSLGSLHAMEGDRWKMTEEEKNDGTR